MAAFNGQEPDKWNGLAYLLAELIEKYADKLDIDNLPVARMDNVHNSNTDDCSKIDFSVESRKAVYWVSMCYVQVQVNGLRKINSYMFLRMIA